jgi:AraC-type transcriptional regulator N-terminus
VVGPTLGVIAQGVKETTLNGRTFSYGPGQYLVVSVELPLVGHIAQASAQEPLLAVVLELRPEGIASLLLETAPAATIWPGIVGGTPAGIAVSDASPSLLSAIGRLLALLDAPDDVAALSAGVERGILWRLITGPQGGDRATDRAGRQPAYAPRPRGALDSRPLRRVAGRIRGRGPHPRSAVSAVHILLTLLWVVHSLSTMKMVAGPLAAPITCNPYRPPVASSA